MRSGPWRQVASLYVALACACGPLGSVPDTAADDAAVNASEPSPPAAAGSAAVKADGGTGTASMTASNDLCERRTVQS
jgi:hypothetical protein